MTYLPVQTAPDTHRGYRVTGGNAMDTFAETMCMCTSTFDTNNVDKG